MDSAQAADLVSRLPMSDGSRPPPFVPEYTLVSISGEGLKPARERRCHWATVLEAREALPGPEGGASTKLVRLDIGGVSCGNYYVRIGWREFEGLWSCDELGGQGTLPACRGDYCMRRLR